MRKLEMFIIAREQTRQRFEEISKHFSKELEELDKYIEQEKARYQLINTDEQISK